MLYAIAENLLFIEDKDWRYKKTCSMKLLKDSVPMVITGEYFSKGVEDIKNLRRY